MDVIAAARRSPKVAAEVRRLVSVTAAATVGVALGVSVTAAATVGVALGGVGERTA